MIRVEHLYKSFGTVKAVDGVSFDVTKGEVVGFLGPNGAGKTTTMRIITGYLTADRGDATIDGIPIVENPIEARRRLGYLPENAPLYLDLEVTEYLRYIAYLRAINKSEVGKRIKEMVATCGLGDVVGRPIGELSKGYRQRVGLASAMIHHPPILILDEPTSGLDPNQIVEIRNLIREIGKSRTVILSTHILQEVEATCSKALIISRGQIVGMGTIDELIHRGGARSYYTITVRAPRNKIEEEITKLARLQLGEWLSEENSERQKFTLLSNDKDDFSEDLFKWAIDCKFTLSELKRETASLEEIFRELTS